MSWDKEGQVDECFMGLGVLLDGQCHRARRGHSSDCDARISRLIVTVADDCCG